MSNYAVAKLDDIAEQSDGRCPWRPVRGHFGITSFGANAWTGKNVGDRIINEHDEDEPGGNEELYFVLQGRAVFELDGERVDAPAGTLVVARPTVKRTAFAEEPETTVVALGGTPGEKYEPHGWEFWAPMAHLYESGEFGELADGSAKWSRSIPSTPTSSTTSPAARASPAGPTTRSSICVARSNCRPSGRARSHRTTRTSARFATSPRSRN